MRTTWRASDGLPEDTVQSIQETGDGSLWVGTTGGVTRFDGAHFTRSALAEGSIFSMLAARDGSLWLGTEGAGLVVMRQGSSVTISTAQGLTDGFVRAILEDRRGRIWIGTDDGLFWMEGNQAHRLDTTRFASPLSVHALMEDADGKIWIGGSKVLVLGLPEDGSTISPQWTEYTLPGAYSENRVKSIVQTRDGDIWVGTVGGLDHLAMEGSGHSTASHFVRIPSVRGTVRTLRQTSDGNLWVGTIGQGLYLAQPGKDFVRFGLASKGGISTVLALFEDDSHQIWVGSQAGLIRLRPDPIRIVQLPGDRPPDFATLSRDRGNALWAVSSKTFLIDHGTAVATTFPGLKGVPVRMVFRDRAGTLWLGTDGLGVYHETTHGIEHYLAPLLVNNFVRGFLEAANGDLWVATDEGVSRFTGGQVHNLRMSDGLAYFSTRSMLQGKDGAIWIGTERGISCWKGGHFVSNVITQTLAREKVWSILQTEDGTLWFGTRDHGLFRATQSGITHFRVPQGLASDSVYQLLEGADHRIWMSGPAGISSFLPDANAGDQLAVKIYELPTGDNGIQMYGGRQPAGAVDANGVVWFMSDRGAVGVLPEDKTSVAPPRASITGIAVDGRPLDATTSSLDLSQSQSRIEISFAPLLLRPQASVRIRYRLEGYDDAWTVAGSARSVSYTRLPAGSYQFQLAVFEADEPSRVSRIVLPLRIRPYFYKTLWFIALCLLIAALLAVTIYRLRVRQVRLRFEAVIGERNRLAREMHDTVIQGCTGVSALLEALSSLGEENRPLREDLVEHARVQVRATIDEARQAVWNLRSTDRLCVDLPEKIEQLAAQFRNDYATEVLTHLEGVNRPLGDFAARELLMVIREAVYNASLHGSPRRIEIGLQSQVSTLTIEIRDDGIGFSLETATQTPNHYGIAGMRERIQRLQGEFHLHSQIGQGTLVRARLQRASLAPDSSRSLEL